MTLKPSPSLIAGAVLTGLIAVAAVVSFIWTPHDPTAIDVARKLAAPSADHLLGTDHLGRDVLSMLIAGSRGAIAVALAAVGLGLAAGVPLGLVSAALPGWRDEWIMRGSDLAFAFPSLVLAILLAAVLGPGSMVSILAIGVFNIPVFARLTRGAALSLWTRDFILAARTSGKGRGLISLQHVLPNLSSVLIVQATTQMSIAVVADAALAYVGLGAQPPAPNWGRMLSEAQTLLGAAPLQAVIPGAVIVITVLGLNLLGDGLRDLTDPRRERGR